MIYVGSYKTKKKKKLQQVIKTLNDLIARAGEWKKRETTMNSEEDGDEIVM